MLSIRCKECGREVSGHPTQARSCGCPNMATVMGDSITAVDLNRVIMVNSGKSIEKVDSDIPMENARAIYEEFEEWIEVDDDAIELEIMSLEPLEDYYNEED